MGNQECEFPKPDLKRIETDLKVFDSFPVVLFGSYVNGEYIEGHSDIDVAILSFSQDQKKNLELWKWVLAQVSLTYDIKIFELLPLFLKINLINNYFVLFGNELEISECFYPFRTLWDDMKYRIGENRFKTIQEHLKGIKQREELRKKALLG